MACRGLRFSLFVVFVIFGGASVSLLTWFSGSAFGQESDNKTTHSSLRENDGDRPYLRDRLEWNWNERGRTVPRGESAARLRFRAYRQKMAMRAKRATPPPAFPSGSTVWVPVGPAPLASDGTGDGAQDYNWVSGRATSVLIDPADSTGNTVLLGGAYGGLWRSTNAGSQNSNPALVTWQALIDDQPTLAVCAFFLASHFLLLASR
jgi:hypothetical protein